MMGEKLGMIGLGKMQFGSFTTRRQKNASSSAQFVGEIVNGQHGRDLAGIFLEYEHSPVARQPFQQQAQLRAGGNRWQRCV